MRRHAQADFELCRRLFPNGVHIREVEKQLAAAAKTGNSHTVKADPAVGK